MYNDKYSSYMKNKRLEILQKVANGELTPKQADKQLLSLSNVIASDFLTSRKLPYGNTMKAIFNKHPQMWEVGIYHKCKTFLHEGYMLAVRRLKNNSL